VPDIILTPQAQKDFNSLRKKNPPIFRRIVAKIKSLSADPEAGEMLVGQFKGVRSLRVGNYRILYENSEGSIYIYSIKRRSKAYR